MANGYNHNVEALRDEEYPMLKGNQTRLEGLNEQADNDV